MPSSIKKLTKTRIAEFFEGEDNRLSMGRLTMFLSFFPSSYVLIYNPNDMMFGWYVSAYVLGYVGGKMSDKLTESKTKKRRRYEPDPE
jgi:hypothetical protein